MKKIEYLENVPKADIDTAQKLMSRLDEITAHLKSKFYLFYNSIYKVLKTYNSDFFSNGLINVFFLMDHFSFTLITM